MMDELPHHESFHQVDVVMEGMANLRPQLLGNLLQECRSVKVKRLFLWYAERHGHSWLKHLDQSSIDLGLGKRQLVPAGRFDARYQITLPTELPDLDRHSVTYSIAGDRSRLSEPHCLFAGGRSVLVSDEEYLTETKLDANDNAAAESRLESTIMLEYPHRRRK